MSFLFNPLFALLCYGLAIGTAVILVRLPRIDRELQANADRQLSLDGLRGYLALGVVIHHVVIYYPYLHTSSFDLPDSIFYSQLGRTSVAFFFMITGYLFWSRVLAEGGALHWSRFLLGRLFRIYPLYLLVLALVLLIVFAEAEWQLRTTLAELGVGLAGWLIFQRPALNEVEAPGDLIANVSWTLSYELFFYLALPAFTLVFVRRGHWLRTLLCLLVIYALYKVMGASSVLKHSTLLTFLGGVAAAYWVRSERRLALGRSAWATVLALGSVALVLFGSRSTFAPLPLALLTVAFCVIASGNELFGALRPRAIRWLGDISYSTYLLHGLTLWFGLVHLPAVFGLDPRSPLYFYSVAMIAPVALVALSSLSYLYIERPGITLGKRLGQRLRTHRARLQPEQS